MGGKESMIPEYEDMETGVKKYSFREWKKLLNAVCEEELNLSISDICDLPYRDLYDDLGNYEPDIETLADALNDAGELAMADFLYEKGSSA